MASTESDTSISIKVFTWDDWGTLWTLRRHQLLEHGIQPGPSPQYPALDSSYEQDYHCMDTVYLHGAGNFWIAWIGDIPAGHIGAQDVGGAVELRRMYVRSDCRRRGIGLSLVQRLIEHCTAHGVKVIELWTAADGPGCPLYEKAGFRTTRERGPEFVKVPVLAGEIRMRLELKGREG